MNGEGERRSLSGLGGGTSEMPRMRTHQTQVGSAPAYEYDPPPPFTNEALNKWEKAR